LNILITGATGFLGRVLVSRLSAMGHEVSLLIRNSANVNHFADLNLYKIGKCNSDFEIHQFIADVSPEVVIHTICCYGRRGESIVQIIDANIRVGATIIDAINNCKKQTTFINAGTVLSRDTSFYALTKNHFGELGFLSSNDANQYIQFIDIKLQHMYGPGDHPSKFTTHVINACRNNSLSLPLTLGDQKRDFIYIDDVVDAYIKILENLPKLKDGRKLSLDQAFQHL